MQLGLSSSLQKLRMKSPVQFTLPQLLDAKMAMELLKTQASATEYRPSLHKMPSSGGIRSQRRLNSNRNSKQDGGCDDESRSAG